MRAYERLLNYVKVYTTSDPVSDTHPTTARQFDLARMLVKELQDIQKRVTVIDSDAARCQEMSEKFPGVLVIPPPPATKLPRALDLLPIWILPPMHRARM